MARHPIMEWEESPSKPKQLYLADHHFYIQRKCPASRDYEGSVRIRAPLTKDSIALYHRFGMDGLQDPLGFYWMAHSEVAYHGCVLISGQPYSFQTHGVQATLWNTIG